MLWNPSKPTFSTTFVNWQKIKWEVFSVCVSQPINLFEATNTMMDLVSNATKCNPERDRTLDSATALNTFSERSTMAQSSDKPWHL